MVFVSALVVFDGHRAGFTAGNAGLDALLLERVAEPLGVIAPVGPHPLCFRQVVEQSRRSGVVADLASCDEEAQRTSVGIGVGVQLGVHAALGPSDQAPEIPFFTPRLEAVRWALK